MNNNLNDNLEFYNFDDVKVYIKKDTYICDDLNRPYTDLKNYIHVQIEVGKIAKLNKVDLKTANKDTLIKLNRYIEDNNEIFEFTEKEIYVVASIFDKLLCYT
jgi:hypothetical protein